MCGIVGYIGPKPVVPVIIEGLRRLEYRGYDSAGIAVAGGDPNATALSSAAMTLEIRRAPGKLANLKPFSQKSQSTAPTVSDTPAEATHGRPTEENAHPHRDGTGTLVVVHNGIVENYLTLKTELIARRVTDSLAKPTPRSSAHLIEDELDQAAIDSGTPRPSSQSWDQATEANNAEAI